MLETNMTAAFRMLGIAVFVAAGAAIGIDARLAPAVPAARDAAPPHEAPGADWPSFGWDVARSSAPAAFAGITASNVASLRLQKVALDGTVDGSAIYLHAVRVNGGTRDALFLTTTYGKTLAIDAADGTILWRFTPPEYERLAGSYRITTATPVADPDRLAIYAASPDGIVRKLRVSDGRVLWSTPVTLLPRREKIASPLNFFRARVIAVTGGYIGDAPPYQGHVAVLDAATGRLLHVWNSLCSDRHELIEPKSCRESDSAIWGRAGAVIDSSSGDIFVATGNGRWDGRTHWGDAVLELDSAATQLLGNYTPGNTASLDATDADLGSTSPVLLGGGLVAQGGKDGSIRLLDWRAMRGSAPHRAGEIATVKTPSGSDLFTAPAVWRALGATWLFAADNGGTSAWTVSAAGFVRKWHNGHGGTSPLVADSLLFVYDPRGGLRVYSAPTGALLTTLATGSGHWNSPMVADGRIVLPEGDANSRDLRGTLDIWRLP